MRSTISRSSGLGFTMVEFMVTVAVLVVVLAVTATPLSDFAATNQVASSKSEFAASIGLARTEAARRGQTVILQAVAGGTAGNEFAAGWELYADADGNGAVGGGDALLRRFDAPSARIKLHGNASLAFRATGYLVGGMTLDYTVCRASGSNAGFRISVTPSGIADVAAISTC